MDKADYQSGLGPAVRELLARDEATYLFQSGSTPCVSAVRHAEGVWLEDADGRRIMDFHGNSCHHLGYAHPTLTAALIRQLGGLTFSPRRFTCAPAVELAERLGELWPGGEARVLLATGGSDAIEIALKLARVATGRRKFLSFYEFLSWLRARGAVGERAQERSDGAAGAVAGGGVACAALLPAGCRRGGE